MPQVTGSRRLLPYPLDYEAGTEAQTPYTEDGYLDMAAWPTDDSDENIRIVFDLSLHEFVALASAIDVGRDIAYGDNSVYVWWIWVKALASMNICEDVAWCIENSAAVRAALAAWQDSQNQAGAAAGMDGIKADNLGFADCDPDKWWSACLSLVQRLNRINEDALETLEAETNVLDWLAEVVGSITFVDESSVDAALAWASFLQDNIAENYVSQYTLAYEEEVACDLFCIALENCSLSAEQIFDYFWARVGSGLSWESLLDNALGYLVGRAWTGTQIADFMMLSQIAMRRFFGVFIGQSAFGDISNAIRVGMNSPDADWEILCDECPTFWEQEFDFTIDEQGWYAEEGPSSEAYAAYVPGVGWQTTDTASANGRRVGILFDAPAFSFTEAEMEFQYVRGAISCPTYPFTALLRMQGEGVPIISRACAETPISPLVEEDGQTLASGTLIALLRSSGSVPENYSGSATITKITFRGTGTNPFTTP